MIFTKYKFYGIEKTAGERRIFAHLFPSRPPEESHAAEEMSAGERNKSNAR